MTRLVVIVSVMVTAACALGAWVILAASFGLSAPPSWGFRAFPTIFAGTFTWVGAALVWRRPRNAVGWVLLGVGVVSATRPLLSQSALFRIVCRGPPLT